MRIKEIKTYLKISWRNIIRNKRRTILTSLSIFFGLTGLILFNGYIEASYEGLREMTIRSRLGHIQLTRTGYREKGSISPLEYSINNYYEIIKELEKIQGIKYITKRVEYQGLLSNNDSSVTFWATGVDADIDTKMNRAVTYEKGIPVSSSSQYGIVVGTGLAKKLDLNTGGEVTLLTSYGRKGINAVDFSVAGIINTGSPDLDAIAITVPIETSWSLLGAKDVHKIIIMLENTRDTNIVFEKIKQIIKEKKYDLEVKSWEELAVYYQAVKGLFNTIFSFISLIVIIVVIFTIANTVMMSVFERMREIGSIRAIGTKAKGVLMMYIFEGMFIGLIGGIGGIILGSILSVTITKIRIIMPPAPGMTIGYPLVLMLVPGDIIKSFIIFLITSIIAGIFPARKAAKLKIVDSIRSV